jgi:hypothetical protein
MGTRRQPQAARRRSFCPVGVRRTRPAPRRQPRRGSRPGLPGFHRRLPRRQGRPAAGQDHGAGQGTVPPGPRRPDPLPRRRAPHPGRAPSPRCREPRRPDHGPPQRPHHQRRRPGPVASQPRRPARRERRPAHGHRPPDDRPRPRHRPADLDRAVRAITHVRFLTLRSGLRDHLPRRHRPHRSGRPRPGRRTRRPAMAVRRDVPGLAG